MEFWYRPDQGALAPGRRTGYDILLQTSFIVKLFLEGHEFWPLEKLWFSENSPTG